MSRRDYDDYEYDRRNASADADDFDFPEPDRDYSSEFYDKEDGFRGTEKEYTVSTQGFYEQYGDEIRASVRDVSEEEIYNDIDEEEFDEEEWQYHPPAKKRKKKRYLLKFLMLCIVIGAVVAFLFSPFFNIKVIKVEGEHNYRAEEIIKASGVKAGMNIFKVSEGDVRDAIKKDAYFSSVSIKRKLPRQLTIIVSERSEAAYVKYGKSKVIIDKDGYVLRKTDDDEKLTELTNMKIKKMKIGEKIKVEQEMTLKKTLDVIRAMRKADIFFKRIEIKNVFVTAYIKNDFICKGKPANIIKHLNNGNLKRVISDLYAKNKKKGTITLGDGNYCSYSPKVQ